MGKFINKMLSAESDVSSKRVNGTICVFAMVIIVTLSFIFDWEIKSAQENLLSTVFWGGVVLLGATGVEKLMKK